MQTQWLQVPPRVSPLGFPEDAPRNENGMYPDGLMGEKLFNLEGKGGASRDSETGLRDPLTAQPPFPDALQPDESPTVPAPSPPGPAHSPPRCLIPLPLPKECSAPVSSRLAQQKKPFHSEDTPVAPLGHSVLSLF